MVRTLPFVSLSCLNSANMLGRYFFTTFFSASSIMMSSASMTSFRFCIGVDFFLPGAAAAAIVALASVLAAAAGLALSALLLSLALLLAVE